MSFTASISISSSHQTFFFSDPETRSHLPGCPQVSDEWLCHWLINREANWHQGKEPVITDLITNYFIKNTTSHGGRIEINTNLCPLHISRGGFARLGGQTDLFSILIFCGWQVTAQSHEPVSNGGQKENCQGAKLKDKLRLNEKKFVANGWLVAE